MISPAARADAPAALSSPEVTAAVEQARAFFERPVPEHEYSAVARALVDPVLEELTG